MGIIFRPRLNFFDCLWISLAMPYWHDEKYAIAISVSLIGSIISVVCENKFVK